MLNNKERFTNRVESYVKFRPSYPADAIDFLYDTVGFKTGDTIADIGAGTGIFSRLLLERGSSVVAVEPNEAMRQAALEQSSGNESYRSVSAAAEETGLPETSVHHIVCAQSFHWFKLDEAQREFRRILKPGGRVALIWNSRKTEGSPLLEQFEELLLTYGTDYEQVAHKNITLNTLKPFFAGGGPALERFVMKQQLDKEALKGRVLSSSYSPLPGHVNYEPMIQRLNEVFAEHQKDGVVTMQYDTELYWGEV